MHLAYIESGYPPPGGGGGGAGTFVQLAGRELVRRGHRISVIARGRPDWPEHHDDEGVQVYRPRLTGAIHGYLAKLPFLRRYAEWQRLWERRRTVLSCLDHLDTKERIDLLEVTEGAVRPVVRGREIPYVCHLHGSRYTFLAQTNRPHTAGDWLQRKAELDVIRGARVVLSPSQALLSIVEKEAGQPFRKTFVLPYPLEPKLLQETNPAPRETLEVIFAARNDPVKGADVLLKAIPEVLRAVPAVQFSLYGFEPKTDQTMPPNTRTFSFVPKETLLEAYRSADLAVVPSFWDNSPNTVYEAMAAGLPLVASRVGGIPELVADQKTGILVPPGDHEALAAGLIRLLRNTTERQQMAANARARITERASLSPNIDKREALYTEVLEATP